MKNGRMAELLPLNMYPSSLNSYRRVAMDPGVVAVKTEIIMINKHGASILMLVHPSGQRPALAVAFAPIDIFRLAAMQLQFE